MENIMSPHQSTRSNIHTSVTQADDGFEYLVVTVGAGSASAAHQRRQVAAAAKEVLAERAESGRWDLVRTVLYQGGVSRHWMRRRITRVASTLG
jgi:hypothetical protein